MREWLAEWVYNHIQIPEKIVYRIIHEPASREDVLKQIETLLKDKDLTMTERTLLVGFVLDKLEALPLREMIGNSSEGILVNGRLLDVDGLRVLRDAAKTALDNKALNFIAEQVVWIAIQRGIHNADTPDKLYFYRAAIWFSEQMKAHLQILAQQGVDNPLTE